MYKLRYYQQEAINKILECKNDGVVVLPTGSGKTVIFTELVKQNASLKFLILTDRRILIDQTSKYLKDCLNYRLETRQKLGLKDNDTLKNFLKRFDFILIDEAHGVNHEGGTYQRITELRNDKTKIVGFTATPYRLDNGAIYGKDKIFKEVIYNVPFNELEKQGFLVPLDYHVNKAFTETIARIRESKGLDNRFNQEASKPIFLQAVADVILENSLKQTIIYATCIKHGELILNILRESRLRADIVHSKQKNTSQVKIDMLKNGEIDYLVNVNILTTGFDFPALSSIIIARPTESKSLYIQMLGRATRICEGKSKGVVYDLVNNFERFGGIDDGATPIHFTPKNMEEELGVIREKEEREKREKKELEETRRVELKTISSGLQYGVGSLVGVKDGVSSSGNPMWTLDFLIGGKVSKKFIVKTFPARYYGEKMFKTLGFEAFKMGNDDLKRFTDLFLHKDFELTFKQGKFINDIEIIKLLKTEGKPDIKKQLEELEHFW